MTSTKKHIIIFSHGFGVRKDDRGLFSDIAASLTDSEPVLFDYNEVHEATNTLTVRPLGAQAKMFKEILENVRENNPDTLIDVICHSQGALSVALLSPEGIRKTILIAPSFNPDIDRMVSLFKSRPGTEIHFDGTSKLSRLDGSTTIVPAEYWEEYERVRPIDLYNSFAERTELTIVIAKQDEILGHRDTRGLNAKINIVELDGAHNFAGEPRKILLNELKNVLQSNT